MFGVKILIAFPVTSSAQSQKQQTNKNHVMSSYLEEGFLLGAVNWMGASLQSEYICFTGSINIKR